MAVSVNYHPYQRYSQQAPSYPSQLTKSFSLNKFDFSNDNNLNELNLNELKFYYVNINNTHFGWQIKNDQKQDVLYISITKTEACLRLSSSGKIVASIDRLSTLHGDEKNAFPLLSIYKHDYPYRSKDASLKRNRKVIATLRKANDFKWSMQTYSSSSTCLHTLQFSKPTNSCDITTTTLNRSTLTAHFSNRRWGRFETKEGTLSLTDGLSNSELDTTLATILAFGLSKHCLKELA